jgi:hypothetical protein
MGMLMDDHVRDFDMAATVYDPTSLKPYIPR